MTNSREQGHDATGSPWQPGQPVGPGVTRRHFLQATGLGAAAAAGIGISAGTAAAATDGGRPTTARPLAAGLTGTISDLKHVVILMQENRSFDHYFGTLSGVRGFADKQALTWQNGNSVFQQPDSARTDLGYLLPYNLTDQTDGDLDHSWSGDHEACNSGLWNQWVAAKGAETMGYFTRSEIPFHYSLADAFTICDGYHQAIMGPTSPNRMYFWTGTSSGWTSNPSDYKVDFGSDAKTSQVTTYPELLQAAGVSWQVYTNDQVGDSGSYPDYFLGDFGDNPLWFYQQYNTTNSTKGGTGTLATRGAVTKWQTAKGAPALSPDARRLRAVIVHRRGSEQHPAPGVVDRGARLVLRAPVLHPRLRRPLREHRAPDAVRELGGVEQHGAVRHLRRARRVLRPPTPALPRMITGGTWSIRRREHHKSLTAQLRVCQSHLGSYIVLACIMVQLSMRTPTRCSTRMSRLSTPRIRLKIIGPW